jgi:hypothetical protein
MVGKRKRETAVVSRSTKTKEASPPPPNDAQDIFRKYFESQFEPIEADVPSKRDTEESGSEDKKDIENDEDISEPDSDWDGVSEESDEDNVVEVVEHRDASFDGLMDKKARKAFMVYYLKCPFSGPQANNGYNRVRNHHLPRRRRRRQPKQLRRTTRTTTPTMP